MHIDGTTASGGAPANTPAPSGAQAPSPAAGTAGQQPPAGQPGGGLVQLTQEQYNGLMAKAADLQKSRDETKAQNAQLTARASQADEMAQAILARAQQMATRLPEQLRSVIPQGLTPLAQLNMTEAFVAALTAQGQTQQPPPAQPAPAVQQAQQQIPQQPAPPAPPTAPLAPFAPPLPPVQGTGSTPFEERFARFAAATEVEQMKLLDQFTPKERQVLFARVRPAG